MRKALTGAMVAASLAAAPAMGATYCVPAHTGCIGLDRTTLAAAVTDANGTPAADDIYLTAGTFTGGVTVGSYPIHVHGAGRDATKIEGGAGSYGVGMDQPGSSISDLTIHELPGGHATALSLSGAAQRVVVDQRDNASSAYAAVILREEGSFEEGKALAPLDSPGADYGIAAESTGPMLISGVQAQGRYAMTTDGPGPVTIRFARLTGDYAGVNASAADTLVEDSVISGGPLVAYLSSGPDITTTVRHVTLNGTYAGVKSLVSGGTARMILSNTAVVAGGPDPETPDLDIAAAPAAVGEIDADYSFFRAAHAIQSGGGTAQYSLGTHNIDGADAQLVNLGLGDLRPSALSPLVDTGDPVPAGGEPQSDLAGEFRAVNGRTDIGAYEYGRHAPELRATAAPSVALAGVPITFSTMPSDQDPGESPTVAWAFDDGTTAAGPSAIHAFATTGSHIVTATATDPAGVTGKSTVTVSIALPPRVLKPMAPAFGFGKLVARKGVVGLLLSCPATATDCTGTVELRLAAKPKAKAKPAKVVMLGKARYSIVRGARKTIRLKLSKSARKRLQRAAGGLRVKAVLKPAGAKTASKTVRLKRR